MMQKPDPGISATPHEGNLRYFNVVIAGPQDSAYDGASCLFPACVLAPPREANHGVTTLHRAYHLATLWSRGAVTAAAAAGAVISRAGPSMAASSGDRVDSLRLSRGDIQAGAVSPRGVSDDPP